jgi:hypothetical protein
VQKVIRLDEVKDSRQVDIELATHGICTILCTISMLSNPGLGQLNFFANVPVERLVVDEASQIYVGQYLVCCSPLVPLLKKAYSLRLSI